MNRDCFDNAVICMQKNAKGNVFIVVKQMFPEAHVKYLITILITYIIIAIL